jgi:DNA modification methylase
MGEEMIKDTEERYFLKCIDGSKGMSELPDKSVKLIYGSPPYPDAVRNYGVWKTSEYIERISPFIESARRVLTDDGF